MAEPRPRQSAANGVCAGQARTVRATFTAPTGANNLVVVVAVCATGSAVFTGPAGFTLVRDRVHGLLRVAVWYREACPALTSVTVSISKDRNLQIRALEYEGVAQLGALDKVSVQVSTSRDCRTGATGVTAQADALVLSIVANRYASTRQSAFTGGLARLLESVSPERWGFLGLFADPDERRTVLTVHQAVSSQATSWALTALLSAIRDWICIIITFRGGTSGPVRATAVGGPPVLIIRGRAAGTVFGPITAVRADAPPSLRVTWTRARVGPYDRQMLINGWGGLLIGNGTPWRVEKVEGLEGWDLRTSDTDQPRNDGALRGVDLQGARLVLITANWGAGDERETEQLGRNLYRALIPQRDQDWPLIFRNPGEPLKLWNCRPTNVIRELTADRAILAGHPFALRGADPRHYSAFERQATVPVTPPGAAPVLVSAPNLGNGPAYPLIQVVGPSSGDPVTRVELRNTSNDSVFAVEAVLPGGAQLVGDMESRSVGSPRSVVTIDGQSKYGGWVQPRRTFVLNPGGNVLELRTVPEGAEVAAEVVYRDTWAG